jgi:uncharacterized protein with beta-barrel porin domain
LDTSYTYQIDDTLSLYTGLGLSAVKIDGYKETQGLDTGLAIGNGDINAQRIFMRSGLKYSGNLLRFMNRKIQTTLHIGLEHDITNTIDKYSFTSSKLNVATNIKKIDIDQSAITLGYNMQYIRDNGDSIGAGFNARNGRTVSGYNVGMNYNIRF